MDSDAALRQVERPDGIGGAPAAAEMERLDAAGFRIISPDRPLSTLRELWGHRELLYFLIWRDVKVRYKQTAVGVVWSIIQPLLLMLIFTAILGRLLKVYTGDVPYPVFAFAGLVPWMLFAAALSQSTSSLITDEKLISKVYFPRVLIPAASLLASVVDFLLAFVVFAGFMAWYRIVPDVKILALPAFLLLALVSALGLGMLLSALNVRYRDVYYAIPFLIQIAFFATPVFYPTSLIPEGWRLVLGLNPMAGVIDGFRWSLFGGDTNLEPLVAVSAGVGVVLFVLGLTYFQKVEGTFADVI